MDESIYQKNALKDLNKFDLRQNLISNDMSLFRLILCKFNSFHILVYSELKLLYFVRFSHSSKYTHFIFSILPLSPEFVSINYCLSTISIQLQSFTLHSISFSIDGNSFISWLWCWISLCSPPIHKSIVICLLYVSNCC